MINLKEARTKENLSQDDLAILCGVARSTITMIENGDRKPSIDLAKKIAKVLKFDWSKFFED